MVLNLQLLRAKWLLQWMTSYQQRISFIVPSFAKLLASQLWGHLSVKRLKTSQLIISGWGKFLCSFVSENYMQKEKIKSNQTKPFLEATLKNKQSRGTAWNTCICSVHCREKETGWMNELQEIVLIYKEGNDTRSRHTRKKKQEGMQV